MSKYKTGDLVLAKRVFIPDIVEPFYYNDVPRDEVAYVEILANADANAPDYDEASPWMDYEPKFKVMYIASHKWGINIRLDAFIAEEDIVRGPEGKAMVHEWEDTKDAVLMAIARLKSLTE